MYTTRCLGALRQLVVTTLYVRTILSGIFILLPWSYFFKNSIKDTLHFRIHVVSTSVHYYSTLILHTVSLSVHLRINKICSQFKIFNYQGL